MNVNRAHAAVLRRTMEIEGQFEGNPHHNRHIH